MWASVVKKRRKGLESPVCFLFVLGLGLVTGCPSDCVCKWKGGKQNVECVNRSLRTFPPTIDPGTQVLDVSGNSFETLPPDHFMRSGLINLQKIYLSKSRLSHINSRAFRGLSNLVDLDLSHNLLREVPSSAFPDCQGLMRLILSGNPIAHIQKRAFVALEALTSLEITHSNLDIIEHGAFEGLHSLEWLKLNGNRLKRLGGLGSLPLGLKGVWLEENPWECDCQLLELRLWLEDRNVANSVEPRCLRPQRLANSTLKELSIDNFACTPQLSPTTMYQKIGEGKNVSLLCKVSSVPEASLEWLFNGQPLSNSSLNLLVETTNAYSTGSGAGYPSNGSPIGSSTAHQTSPHQAAPIEKKSELIILNATSEENGTFLCVAKNPAGVAMANFTVRVLTKYDSDIAPDAMGTIPLFVSSYPNLFIIVLSTVAVIGFVIVLFVISLLVCKCSRLCGCLPRRGHRSSSSSPEGRNGKKGHSKNKGSNGNDKDGTLSSVVSVCGGKLDRHLSETSTLTTHTKSNGSVFLLSTSSELGDSNPDLIEGVNKRVEGDGHETSFSHFNNGSLYCSSTNVNNGDPLVPNNGSNTASNHSNQPTLSSSSGYHYHPNNQQQQQHYATLGRTPTVQSSVSVNTSAVILEPSQFNNQPPGGQYNSSSQGQFNPFPMDYGLPKSLNVGTLVRRSPSYPVGVTTVSCSGAASVDLAKYPKEYISPQQQQQQHQQSISMSSPSSYGYVPGPVIYAQSPHQEYYPTYILPPGTYVTTYSGPGGEEYAVATMGTYLDSGGQLPPPVNCSCGPILEGNESDEGRKCDEDEGDVIRGVNMGVSKGTMATSPILGKDGESSRSLNNMVTPTDTPSKTNCNGACVKDEVLTNSSDGISNAASHSSKTGSKVVLKAATSAGSCSNSNSNTNINNNNNNSNNNNNNNNIQRLQRQLTTQINESPDEGYEDEGAEGTEI